MQVFDPSFAPRVWNTLSKIEVEKYVLTMDATEKRPEVGYLPWHRAWALLKEKFPASTYHHRDDIVHADGTVEVSVVVKIRELTDGPYQKVKARLAVMDFYFGAIIKPNARDINDSRQRCLVKALAFAGLGLNLWDNTNVPVGYLTTDMITADQVSELEKLIEDTGADRAAFLEWGAVDAVHELPQAMFRAAIALLKQKAKASKAAKKNG